MLFRKGLAGPRRVKREQGEDLLTSCVGNMSNTLTEFYKRREIKQDKEIDNVKIDVKEQKQMIDQMCKYINEGFSGIKSFDQHFKRRLE